MMRNRLPVIGVTGVIGSGKTKAAELLKAYGGDIINADELSHAVIKCGKPAYDEILAQFGSAILRTDGEIDRRKLGAAVFGNREQLLVLEQIIHPRTCEETEALINERNQNRKGYTCIVIDAPLLIEAGMHTRCDSVWLLTASDSIRIKRIMLRDSLTEAEAARRMTSRPDDSVLKPFADIVIVNDGDADNLAVQVERAYRDASAQWNGSVTWQNG